MSRISCRSTMLARTSSSSVCRSMRDRRVSWRSCMSRMSLAWISLNSNGAAIKPTRAVAASSLERMRAMIWSMTSRALMRPFEDVLAPPGLVEPELRPAGDDVDLVTHVGDEGVTEVDLPRHPVDQRHHVDRERRLQLRELEQVVLDHVGVGVALERDDQVGLAARRGVVDVGDAVEVAAVDELLDTRGDRRTARLVRDLGDEDLEPAVLALLDAGRRPHLHASHGPCGRRR